MKLEGLEVLDAKRSRPFDITDRDIRAARSQKPDKCAAALACRRAFRTTEVRVHLSRTYIRKGDRWVRYLTPPSLAREIVSLDRGGRFLPGEYTLRAPVETQKLGYVKVIGPKSAGPKKKRSPQHRTANVRIEPATNKRG